MEEQTSIKQPQCETDEQEQAVAEPSIIPPEQVDDLQGDPIPAASLAPDDVPAAPEVQPEVAGDPASGDGEPAAMLDFNLLKSEVLALGKRIFGEVTTLEHEAAGLVLRVAGEVKHVVRLL